ncbi:MAG: YfhO family protein [Chloroflexia bacterium]
MNYENDYQFNIQNSKLIIRSGRVPWIGEAARLAILPALISFVMLWPALLGLGVLAPTDIVAADPLIGGRSPSASRPPVQNPLLGDVVDVFIPWKLYARSEIWQGRFPLWNPYNGLGSHFHASLQSQVLSPFNLLWMILPPLWGLGVITALKWMLCGLGMALLLRVLKLGMLPSVFGSVALQLSGPVLGWLQWPIAEGLAWVPWMLWAALKWLDTFQLRWLAALSAFVAAELLAGHIETSFHSLAFLAVFSLAGLISGSNYELRITNYELWGRRYLIRGLAGLVAAGLLGLGISAAQLLPFLDILTSSQQWVVRAGAQVQHISMPTPTALMWLTPNGFGWPDAYRGPSNWVEANPYVGAVTLLLAAWTLASTILSVVTSRKRLLTGKTMLSPRKPFFWIALLAVSVSMAYGIPPLSFLRELPGFNTSFNSRLISVAGPCVIVFAAMGLDRLLFARTLPRGWAIVLIMLGAIGLLLGVGGMQIWFISSLDVGRYIPAWIAWAGVLFCLGAVLIFARLLGWLRPTAFGVLVLGLLLLDMMRAGWNFNPTSPRETFYPINDLTRFLVERGPEERIAIVGKSAESNTLLALKVPDYRIYDPMVSSRYVAHARLLTPETFRTGFREQDAHYTAHMVLIRPSAVQMAVVGIRWLVADASEDPNSWQPLPDAPPAFKPAFEQNGFRVWENIYAMPYAYFAPKIYVSPDEAAVRERMRAFTMDSRDEVQVEAEAPEMSPGAFPGNVRPLGSSPPAPGEPGENVHIVRRLPREIEIKISAGLTRLVVINEAWEKGWRAAIDGSPTHIYKANYVVQGVVVPTGKHTITLIYDPPAFRWGIGISLTALVGWLGLVYFSVKGQRPKPLPGGRADAS